MLLAILSFVGSLSLSHAINWKSVNILVTTDTHSWLAGHRHADHYPKSDVTLGAFYSFLGHMKSISNSKMLDLFVVDNGDVVDGGGLSNATPEDGEALFPIIKSFPYDALNIGNHELYTSATVNSIKTSLYIEHWNGSFLTSNTKYSDSGLNMGSRFNILVGQYGTRLLTFGFLYNMRDHCSDVTVEKVEEVVEEKWFTNALLNENYDAILVLAHMHLTDPLVTIILNKIREMKGSYVVVQFITGHSHIRGFSSLDPFASSFEAGKFLDTIGFVSFNLNHFDEKAPSLLAVESGVSSAQVAPAQFHWYYINANKQELARLVNISLDSFDTVEGQRIDREIERTRDSLGLDEVLGCSPIHYETEALLSLPTSLWSLYLNHVVPFYLFSPAQNPRQALVESTGSFRYDLYDGPVTVDDIWTMTPFADSYYVFPAVPGDVLVQVIQALRSTAEKLPLLHAERRTPSRTNTLPPYVSLPPLNSIVLSTQYDLISVGFDLLTVRNALAAVTHNVNVSYLRYRSRINSTSIWFPWAKEKLPTRCRVDGRNISGTTDNRGMRRRLRLNT